MSQKLESQSILSLTIESDKLDDVLSETPVLPELSDWTGHRSQLNTKKGKSPLTISKPKSKIQITATHDDYNFIDSFEKLHKQEIKQLKTSQHMERSLRQYSETKRNQEFKSFININVSPDFTIQSDLYANSRTTNQTPQAYAAVVAHYQNSLRDFSGERVSDKVMRLKDNARRIINDNMLFTKKKTRQLTSDKLKRRLILVEKGIEELNRAAEYERTHLMSNEVKDRTKILNMYISPRVNLQSRSSSNEITCKKTNSLSTGSRLGRSRHKHHLFYNLK